MTYQLCKRIIENGNYDKEDLSTKLDVFLLNDRLTQVEYEELVGMISTQ